jgi:hypothetical protein
MRELSYYWDSIPIGKPNRKTYTELGDAWGVSRRTVRLILHRLSELDNGDGLILIRSATTRGFYRTDDPEEIEIYRREVMSKATSLFAPLKKIRRVQGEDDAQLRIKI